MAVTSRMGLPLLDGTEQARTLNTHINNLSNALDVKTDIRRGSGTMVRARSLASYEETSSNLPGYVVVQTNVPLNSVTMTRIDVKGWVYDTPGLIDLSVTFYPFTDGNLYQTDVVNNGSMAFTLVGLYARNSDNKIALVLQSGNASNYWQYPKIWVDGWTGHTSQADAFYTSGWSITRVTSLTGYTSKKTLKALPKGDTDWITVTLTGSSGIHYDGGAAPVQYRRLNGVTRFRGLLGNTVGNATSFFIPIGFRGVWARGNSHHPVTAGDAFGFVRVWNTGDFVPAGTWGYLDTGAVSFPADA